MQVSRWGNSLAVRLPQTLVEELALVEGDEITVVGIEGRTIVVEKDELRKAALDALSALNWPLPADYTFDREEANER